MEINGFAKYDMYIKSSGSYLNVEGDFIPYNNTEVIKDKDGGWILEFIGKRLLDKECCGLRWDGDRLILEFFNPSTGGGDTIWIRLVEEVKDKW